jgi:hypothetical protein
MTLVFAKERSIEAIRDAMFANRTLAFFDNQLAGKEELLTALFRASVTVKPTGRTDGDNQPLYLVTNISTIPYELQTAGGIELIVPAEGSLILPIDPSWLKGVTVKNLITGPKTKLKLDL